MTTQPTIDKQKEEFMAYKFKYVDTDCNPSIKKLIKEVAEEDWKWHIKEQNKAVVEALDKFRKQVKPFEYEYDGGERAYQEIVKDLTKQ